MLAILNKYMKGDRVIWGVVIILSIFSILAVYSSTGMLAFKFQQGNTTHYIIRHLSFMLIGFAMIFITSHLPYQMFSKVGQLLWIVAIPVLCLTLVLGTSLNSAARWLTVPGLGITVQTSDFAKLAIILYVARMLSMHQEDIKDFKNTFLRIIIPVGIICILILPANFSTAALLMSVCMILMFIGRIRIRHLSLVFVAAIVMFGVFILIAPLIHMDGRVKTWKHRIENFSSKDNDEDNFQSEQAKIAIVTGGVIGKGPGNSTQRNFLPHPYSDFIYAIIIEEYGIWGGILVLFLYLYLFFRAGVIVRRCDRTFPAFLVIGLTLMLMFQALINMAVAVNLLPVTGQPLPLLSMGGTSIFFNCIAVGMILSVSRSVIEAKEKEKADKAAAKEDAAKENNQESETILQPEAING